MQLGINVVEEDLGEASTFCRESGYAMEVTAFADPRTLDSGTFDRVVAQHRETIAGITPISVHGPFLDLYTASWDPEIVAVCRARHERAIGAAVALGASVYVAHLNSLPQIRNEKYRETFAKRSAEFWVPFAEEYHGKGLTIVLENMWEPDPELQRLVVDSADHSGLRASFDNGHALVFSDVSAPEWIGILGDALSHCHLHDNDGQYDSHLPIGEGSEGWPELLSAVENCGGNPLAILESDKLERNRKSMDALKEILGGVD